MNIPNPFLVRVRHGAAFLAVCALATVSIAQTASSPRTSSSTRENEAVVLDPFEVVMTQDKGYYVPGSGNALKTNEAIREIPQSITVITRDMIDDIASTNISDVLNYAGVGNFFQGDSAIVRGVRVNMVTDGTVDGNFDPATTDSITIVRGPTAVLYGLQTSLGGAILKNTRVPQHKRFGTLKLTTDQYGFYRADLDATGPIGQVGESKFAYRVDLAHQGGDSYYKHLRNDRDIGYAAFEFKRPETTVRFNATYQVLKVFPHRNLFLTPSGVPYIGAGRDEDYNPPNMDVTRRDQTFRVQALQKLWPGWNLNARAVYSRNSYSQGVMLGSFVDYQTNTARFAARWNRLAQRIYSGDFAVNGTYNIGKLKASSFFGAVVYEGTNNPNFFPGDPTFGRDNAARGVGSIFINPNGTPSNNILVVPMNNPMTERIVVRQAQDYESTFTTGARGTRNTAQQWTEFFQQKIELWPDRVTLVGSVAQFNYFNEQENITIPTPTTITATSVQRQNKLLHRVGAVVNITKDISLYVIESTTMAVQTSRLIDGTITPPQEGRQREVGIKTEFGDGRFSATLGVYDIRLTNVAVSSGLISPITGAGYVLLIGKTVQCGADLSLSARPLPNWQVTFNAYQGTVEDQNGNGRIPNTFEGSLAFFTRYKFTKGDFLKRFAVGGGANRMIDRWITANNIRFADGSVPTGNGTPGSAPSMKLKNGTNSTLFIDYDLSRRMSFKLTVNNLFDEFFAVGAQHAFAIDAALPRHVQGVFTYRF